MHLEYDGSMSRQPFIYHASTPTLSAPASTPPPLLDVPQAAAASDGQLRRDSLGGSCHGPDRPAHVRWPENLGPGRSRAHTCRCLHAWSVPQEC